LHDLILVSLSSWCIFGGILLDVQRHLLVLLIILGAWLDLHHLAHQLLRILEIGIDFILFEYWSTRMKMLLIQFFEFSLQFVLLFV